MCPITLVKRISTYRSLLRIILFASIAALTGWATFTSYSANPGKSNDQSSGVAEGSQFAPGGTTAGTRAKVDKNYGNLPLSFEANRGQTDANVNYIARGPGYNIFLNAAEAVLVFQDTGNNSKEARAEDPDEGNSPHSRQRQPSDETGEPGNTSKANPTVLRVRLAGANANARAIEGIEELPGKVNYFGGNDPSKWLADITTYRKVAYRDAYPGIDVVYYGNRQQLEYDLVVTPGADPGVVALSYIGAQDLRVDHDGNLVLKTPAGEIRQLKPLVYQEVNGAQKFLDGRYVIRGKNSVGFRVSRYDRRKPLVIDPILAYSSIVNSAGNGFAVAVDSDGYAYITGSVATANFNPTTGAYQVGFGGLTDVFVTKVNQNGTNVIYSTYLGGDGEEEGYGIALDAAGNAYITGYASGTFPTTPGAYQTVLGSGYDCFVTKLNATGSALIYSTFYGGNDFDEGAAIAVDGAGNAYVTGDTQSSNLVTTGGAPQSANRGGQDGFVLRLNSAGSGVGYATYLGGGGFDFGIGIAVDSANNAYVAGQTSSLNFAQVNSLQGANGVDRGLFRSANNGASWSLSQNGLTTSYVYSIVIDRNTPTTMYAGTAGGVSKSTDGGVNWVATAPNNAMVQALAIDPSNSSIVYAGTLSGVYKTTNGGGSWTAINSGLGSTGFPPNIRAIAIDPNNPATVYAGGFLGMFKSTNGGASWASSASGLTGQNVRALVIDPVTPSTLYVGLNAVGVFKSTNSGANWTAANSGLGNLSIRSLAIVPNATATLYAGTLNGIFKTTASGTSWSAVNNGLLIPYTDNVSRVPASVNAIVVDPLTPANVYAGSTNSVIATGAYGLTSVLKSTDGGANWTAVTNGFGGLNSGFLSLAINPTNPALVYAGNNGDSEGFAAKINASGNGFVYSTFVGSNRGDYAIGIVADSAGNSYICGLVSGTNLPVTPGAFRPSLSGAIDTFVMKLNAAGTSRLYSTYLGGGSTEDSYGIAVDSAGNAYVTGTTLSTDFPVTSGAFQTTIGNRGSTANSDAFITKLNTAGTAPVYSSYLGGAGNELVGFSDFQGNNIAVDPLGNAYVVGSTSDSNTFPVFDYANAFTQTAGPGQTFVAKIDSNTESYSITGRLTTSANVPIVGVFVEASNGGFFRGGVTDSQGFYSIISLPAGNYTVTPNRYDGSGRHYLYTPPTRTFTGLNSDQTANFTGTEVFDIQGQVTSSTVPGLGIFDVTVTLSGSASATTISDANGNYSFQDLLPGNYTVTPTKAGFTFNPANLSFTNLSADQFSANFTTASATFFTVSGRAADAGNTGIANVAISYLVTPLRGFRTQSTLTDANGNYSIPNLQSGGNYSFLPAKPVLSFTPQNPTLNNLSSNQTLNFLAAPVTGLIGKIAFARSDLSNGISVINADGTGEQSITNNQAFDEWPTWSPDGSKLAFSRQDAGNFNSDIFVMNADGTGVTRLTTSPLDDIIPGWSPDATRLTFTYGECSGSDVLPDVFVMDANGANRTNLTNTTVVDGFSDWSPGGSTIAFVKTPATECSSAEEQGDIYAMDTDGGNKRVLANNSAGESRPAYSPDGSKIAYFRGTASSLGAGLYVMNADGSGQTRIGPDLDIGDNGKPTWSPDGTKIAFAGNFPGVFGPNQIFVINADGTGLAQITSGTASRFDVSWRHYSISGRVTGNSTGLPITMTLAGTLTRVTQTDVNGNYVFGSLAPGGNYTVTPISTAFGFNPAKIDIANLIGNQVANFAVLPAAIPMPTPPLSDDFGGGQRDPAKWNLGTQTQPLGAFDPAVSVVQQSGRLVITPRTNAADLHYNGYVAVNSFDFNNGTATVEVAQTATGGADTIFAIGSDLDNFSRFVVRDGAGQPGVFNPRPDKGRGVAQLIFQVRVGGQLNSLSIPYDPVLHRFMRFRHQPPNNSIAFETSPDNINFTVRQEVVLQKGVSALTAELSAGTSSPTNPPGQTVFDNFNLVTNTVQFSAASLSINEDQGSGLVSVTRSGDTSMPATADYVSFDDSARQSSKYIIATGSLSFASGETTKSIRVLIIDNVFVEGNQILYLNLIDSFGAGLNSPGRSALTIVDNDTTPPTANPLDNSNAQFYVREHYYDFFSREPDPPGFAFWIDQITSCGTDPACVEIRRINVSAAFFISIEFQETGYLVHRFYNASLDRATGLPRYLEFLRDTQTIGRGVVVNAPGWEAQLESNKVGYADKFVLRPEFKLLYPLTLTPREYVDALYAHARIIPSAVERQAAIDEFNTPTGARGRALRRVVENQTLKAREFNRAFVLAQYFGYLRRNPDDPPDNNLDGFNFWLNKLNQFNGNFVDAEMVKAFIVSGEYRGRFGP